MNVTKGYHARSRANATRTAVGRFKTSRRLAVAALTSIALLAPIQARAVDGCKVLLCLAGNWKAIPMCVPPVREALRDVARGRPFPTCGMSGPGNSASHRWASAPAFCPPQYTRTMDGESATQYVCDYRGAVTVQVNGKPWSRVWWNGDDSSTEYFDAARQQLGANIDSKFDQDHASWLAAQPLPDNPNTGY